MGCGLFADQPLEESDVEEVVNVRYGVETDGYKLVEREVGAGETMGSIMRSFGRTASDIGRVNRAAREVFSLRKMRAGNRYVAFVRRGAESGEHLDYIAYERDLVNYVLFVMLDDSVSVQLGERPIKILHQRGEATIESSLWSAIADARMPQELCEVLEDIYQWRINFFNIERGDRFVVCYDEGFVDGVTSVGLECVRGVKFTHKGVDNYAIAFKQGEATEYWDERGRGLRMQILKAPLHYSRVGSRHSAEVVDESDMSVSFAAPTGTPVIAVADGVVSYKGVATEAGNTIRIRHEDNIITGYMHLSRFARGLDRGANVSQGDIIGYVGSSGDSSEPHLGYRMWRGETPIDPIEHQSHSMVSISAANKSAFEVVRSAIVAELNKK